MKDILKDIFDMHVHAAPDVIPRRHTDFDLVDEAVMAGARGIVLKSHQGSTVERAYLCNLYRERVHGGSHFTMYGGIVLNYPVGGINPAAVKSALAMGGKVVWLPTTDAMNDREQKGLSGGISVLDGTRVSQAVTEILRMVRDNDAVLATGHLSASEIFAIADEAQRVGLKKLVITHPEYWVVGLSHEQQRTLARDYGAVLEHCYRQPGKNGHWTSNMPDTLQLITEIGWEHIMPDTDGGQVVNPNWADELSDYVSYLSEHGVPNEAIWHMTRETPAKLLGVEL